VGSNPTPGATEEPTRFQGEILGVLLSLKKLGRKEGTIRSVGKRLRYLGKHCNLDDPESVKKHIAEKDCSSNFKGNLVDAYKHYVKYQGLEWKIGRAHV